MYNNNNMKEVKTGDKLVIKSTKNLPTPIDDSIKTLETELIVEDVNKGGYVTLSYQTTEKFAKEENEGKKKRKINFLTKNIPEFFKFKK